MSLITGMCGVLFAFGRAYWDAQLKDTGYYSSITKIAYCMFDDEYPRMFTKRI
jgi:hypothetical protein